MLEWILLAVGVVGFGAAGYLDLKTTEFPDWLPYSIIIAALVIRGIFAYTTGNLDLIINSITIGVGFLLFGLALYYLRQWGDGDAWLLGALGFLFPDAAGFIPAATLNLPFYYIQIFNFFLVAFAYLIIYSLALGMKNPKIWKSYKKDLIKDKNGLIILIVAFAAIALGVVYYLNISAGIPLYRMYNILLLPPLFIFLILFVRYGRHIEKVLFRKQIDVKDLTAGDVPMTDKWRVLDDKEVKELKKKGGKIWIKEGVRLAPVFIISMLISIFFGTLLVLFI
ncbi:MAG: prepilin peptidase [Candidatus Aenigmatarchaeota archaeon]